MARSKSRSAKADRQKKFTIVFINGKQVRIKRPPTIDGLDADEFLLRNADPLWLHQHEMWHFIPDEDTEPKQD